MSKGIVAFRDVLSRFDDIAQVWRAETLSLKSISKLIRFRRTMGFATAFTLSIRNSVCRCQAHEQSKILPPTSFYCYLAMDLLVASTSAHQCPRYDVIRLPHKAMDSSTG